MHSSFDRNKMSEKPWETGELRGKRTLTSPVHFTLCHDLGLPENDNAS